jgi:glycine/D-amino acid oxidase-like deaminating enzyme
MTTRMTKFDYIIVGAGIAGCSIAYFLAQHNKKVLLLDRNTDFSQTASSAAGGFLSPLLGKPNDFKDLVTQALNYSFNFYTHNFPEEIINKGVLRIPKNKIDEEKFKEYIPYIDFEYTLTNQGCFFPIGSQVNTLNICKKLSQDVEKRFNYEVKEFTYQNDIYCLNSEYYTSHLILTTGADTTLIKEKYLNIRPVWGQRIVVETSTCIDINYHKECSISTSIPNEDNTSNLISIGATHHRFNCDSNVCSQCLKEPNINNFKRLSNDENSVNTDTQLLLERANDIIKLDNVKLKEIKIGARASSVDYFPMVGALIDSEKTLHTFPHIKKGTHVQNHRLDMHKNLFVLNGLGGRGFVLAPYLAHLLTEHLIFEKELPENITMHRLFKRWAKKIN